MFARHTKWIRVRPLLAGLLIAAMAQAALPKLPGKLLLPRGQNSPGPVHFNHQFHVLEDEPNCVTCHPRRFSILKPRSAGLGVITHERMYHGEACGACHGKDAFKFENHCDSCHN